MAGVKMRHIFKTTLSNIISFPWCGFCTVKQKKKTQINPPSSNGAILLEENKRLEGKTPSQPFRDINDEEERDATIKCRQEILEILEEAAKLKKISNESPTRTLSANGAPDSDEKYIQNCNELIQITETGPLLKNLEKFQTKGVKAIINSLLVLAVALELGKLFSEILIRYEKEIFKKNQLEQLEHLAELERVLHSALRYKGQYGFAGSLSREMSERGWKATKPFRCYVKRNGPIKDILVKR
ncbi:uncharacterized protein LOC134214818 [Armigeres subalbatus]|uniref:uncharacterized protein LOC134214818 n=1 Tax=Armigeres subalbatus TaxID=124917 RepID=UPI002ED0CDA8